jgi:hypothetical protein
MQGMVTCEAQADGRPRLGVVRIEVYLDEEWLWSSPSGQEVVRYIFSFIMTSCPNSHTNIDVLSIVNVNVFGLICYDR